MRIEDKWYGAFGFQRVNRDKVTRGGLFKTRLVMKKDQRTLDGTIEARISP